MSCVWMLTPQEGVRAVCCNSGDGEHEQHSGRTGLITDSILFKPTEFAKRHAVGLVHVPCYFWSWLKPCHEPAGLEGFQKSWSLCVASHAALTTHCSPSLLFVAQFVQISPCLLTALVVLSHKELQQFTGIVFSLQGPGAALGAKAGGTKLLCCVDSADDNGSAGLGCYSSRSFGACHSCTAQLLAWAEVLQEGQGCSVSAGTKPRGTTPADSSGIWGSPGNWVGNRFWKAQGSSNQLMAPRWICSAGSGCSSPGSTSLPTGTEVSLASPCTCRDKDLGVGQMYWHLSPPVRPGLSKSGMSLW